ncbi:MAG TPA: YkgJ family cysteine cluster protein [Myxococcota bacterium]|nr:YkgJ family cysteine cluster protein [Myxococcota bacterium]
MTVYDCQRCGACCTNTTANESEGYRDYVAVEPGDGIRKRKDLMKRFVILNNEGEAHLKLDAEGRCAALRGALGRKVWCVIYADRPSPCRRVEAGSKLCLTYRRDKGID